MYSSVVSWWFLFEQGVDSSEDAAADGWMDGWMGRRARAGVRGASRRAMSLAFDEFGRPFIIIKVRARRAERRAERARESEMTTTKDDGARSVKSLDPRSKTDDDDAYALGGRERMRAGTRE